MTTTPPNTAPPQGPASEPGPHVGWDDVRDLARIRRSHSDRKVAGVAGGLGRHLDIDPVILRVAFVVLSFFGGVGLLLYLALWLLVPEDGSDWATIKLDRRSRTAALIIVGFVALALLASHGWWGNPGPFLFLVTLLAVILLGTQLLRRERGETSAPTVTEHPGAVPAQSPESPGYLPPSYVVREQPRPVNPRKKGPILFWYALAVIGVALGALGIADLAGADIAPSAYPATALAVSAGFLLIGSFYGRAGGLVLVGLLSAAVTVGATVADKWDPNSTTYVPGDASQVQSSYHMDVGEVVLDLSSVTDSQLLNGREITVDGNVGHLDIRVPSDVTVVANTHVTGIGGINAFGRDGGGIDTELTAVHSAGPGAPRLVIDAELHVGGIDVHTEPGTRRSRP